MRTMKAEPTNEIAVRLHSLVQNLKAARADVEIREASLKRSQALAREIEEFLIPELMEELGTEIYRLPQDGTEIVVTNDVRANISQENASSAFAWLESRGHGAIIKREVRAAFDKGEDSKAEEACGRLRAAGFDVRVDKNVHNSTLRAWVRGRLESGEEIPQSITTEIRKVAKIG